jgi:hypothetical protein
MDEETRLCLMHSVEEELKVCTTLSYSECIELTKLLFEEKESYYLKRLKDLLWEYEHRIWRRK